MEPLSIKKNSNKFFVAWINMRRRCDSNEKSNHFNRYGKRGITYSPSWKSFDNFYKDMASTYKKGLSLDRIDNDKGYSIENCRWATPKEQSNNTARNRWYTIDGVSKTLAQWIETTSIKSSTVRQRLYVYKWPIEKSLGLIKKEG